MGEAKRPGPGLERMTAAAAAEHEEQLQRLAHIQDEEESREPELLVLSENLKQKYVRYWSAVQHLRETWWEVEVGVWRKWWVVAQAEVDGHDTPEGGGGSSRGDKMERRESVQVQWDRQPVPAPTLDRLRREHAQGKHAEGNPAIHGAGPEDNMDDEETDTRQVSGRKRLRNAAVDDENATLTNTNFIWDGRSGYGCVRGGDCMAGAGTTITSAEIRTELEVGGRDSSNGGQGMERSTWSTWLMVTDVAGCCALVDSGGMR